MSNERSALERAFDHALAHLEALDTRPVAATAGLEALRRALDRPLPVVWPARRAAGSSAG
jgi:hypothetical protein